MESVIQYFNIFNLIQILTKYTVMSMKIAFEDSVWENCFRKISLFHCSTAYIPREIWIIEFIFSIKSDIFRLMGLSPRL